MLTIQIIALINLSLGLLVFARNPRSTVHQVFSLLSLATVAWMISSGYTDHAVIQDREIWAKLAFIFPVFVTASIVVLSYYFPSRIEFKSRTKIFISIITTALVLISASDLIVEGVEPISESSTHIIPGKLYLLYTLALIAIMTKAGTNILKNIKNKSRKTSAQAKNFLLGFVLSFVWVLITNVILPLFLSANTPKYGPLGTIIFLSFTAYTIVKHKLFDIRPVIARSIAYVLLLITVLGIYAFTTIGVAERLFGDDELTRRIVPAVATAFLALTGASLKKIFDKFTNRLFYQDAYDTQSFLDELNKELVSNVDLETLVRKCAVIIQKNLKPDYCVFELKATAYAPQRIIGTADKEYPQEDINLMQSFTLRTNMSVILTDDLPEDSELKSLMRKYDIAILSRLSTDLDLEVEGLGYLLLGPKKSGNPYNKQDLKMIEIITNELVIAIQNALRFEEIEKFNVTLQEKVDNATAQLKRTNEKLKELDETKDEFISMASHQLRTPLTSVKGYLSMVLEGDVGKISEPQRKMLEQAFISSQRMVYLIADLLNVSRLKTGKFIIETKPMNLADVVEGEVNQLIDTAKSRDLQLQYEKPEDFPMLMLDETKIRQVIMNFIDNAIYYTPAGGKISLTLTNLSKTVEFKVEDNGIGVPKSERHNLFNKFYRANNARKARPDGTGLGLFMAKKVIVAQGGAVIFESEEGKGSTFGFSFGKEKLLPPATPVEAPAKQKVAEPVA